MKQMLIRERQKIGFNFDENKPYKHSCSIQMLIHYLDVEVEGQQGNKDNLMKKEHEEAKVLKSVRVARKRHCGPANCPP